MQSSKQAMGLLRSPATVEMVQQLVASTSFGAQQFRHLGGDKVPEFWGKPSAYTEGTTFLGTPKNHLDLVKKRPLSPDVVEIDSKSLHYKMPWGALSSITNRATGVAMSVGFAGAGYLALTGSLQGVVAGVADNFLLAFPLKFLVSYTIVYHWLGGMRHIVWDVSKIGNQADRTSLLELPKVEISSKALFGAAAAISVVLALL
ncbi:Succinate dehydrogenase cytochrome b560 subunit, mitochondrial [Tetrabaena socialis]|uniref:Succinate dehydrogenase cytochrome b560 subunit, mitochondrial n=1 Tax=Tetrabaena socialis TaxID=47790 RepID=A0A2J8A0N5_9CHLO|nr:Succinate dehydrogenase cytochrome b560 subunit, mitochondrial [Tetrabaena socialis]|eukprot:PNH06074.1 Succinate dehydrogenase cytochrome b560 subunit, mitochondrial [Tetrabaena socialis]